MTLQMTKKIKSLEKETTQWRGKWESNNQALLQMAEEVTRIIHTIPNRLSAIYFKEVQSACYKTHDISRSSDQTAYVGKESYLCC